MCRSALAGLISAALRPFPVCLVQHVQIRILVIETLQSYMQTTVSTIRDGQSRRSWCDSVCDPGGDPGPIQLIESC